MVVEISSESDLSNVTVTPGYLTEEEIQSKKVQQTEREPKIYPMAWTRKHPVPAPGPIWPPIRPLFDPLVHA